MDQHDLPDFLALLDAHALARPDAVAVVDGPVEIGYGRFVADIDKVARRLNTRKLVPGSRAILFFRSQYLHWLATLALMRLGVVTVSVFNLAQQDILQMLGAQVLLTDQSNVAAAGGGVIAMGRDWLDADGSDLPAVPRRPFDLRQPVRILLSSGTTGLSKKILYDNQIIGARIRYSTKDYGFGPQHRYMSGTGSDTAGGYVFSIVSWANGAAVAFYDANLPFGPQLAQTGANLLFMSPVQAANMVDSLPDGHQPNGVTLLVAGGRLPQAVAERARRKLASTIWIIYGSTEAGSTSNTQEPDYARPERVGRRVPSTKIEIVDEAGRPLPPDVVGELRIRGICCVEGYLDDPETSGIFFRDGWFYPGDLGTLSATDELSVVGRVGDLMNLGGVKITPGTVEDALAACHGVKELAAFSVPDDRGVESLWIAVAATAEFSEQALRDLHRLRFPNQPAPHIALVESIPRNAMAKAQRNQLREAIKRKLAGEAAGGVAFGFRAASPDDGITANKESNVAIVKINDKEYDFDKLPDDVKAQLTSVQFIDAELQRMNLHRAALQTARTAYLKSVTELLSR